MADTGEIPGWVAGVAAAGTFVGGVIAALFGRKKPEDGNMMLVERITKLETRADTIEHVHVEIFSRLLELDKKASATLAILDERRHER